MKVIKHGNTVKELTCPACGCIFKAVGTDTCYHEVNREIVDACGNPTGTYDPKRSYQVPYFVCPECGHECGEEDMNDEQR